MPSERRSWPPSPRKSHASAATATIEVAATTVNPASVIGAGPMSAAVPATAVLLKMLLPRTLPASSAVSLRRADWMAVTSSGSEVQTGYCLAYGLTIYRRKPCLVPTSWLRCGRGELGEHYRPCGGQRVGRRAAARKRSSAPSNRDKRFSWIGGAQSHRWWLPSRSAPLRTTATGTSASLGGVAWDRRFYFCSGPGTSPARRQAVSRSSRESFEDVTRRLSAITVATATCRAG